MVRRPVEVRHEVDEPAVPGEARVAVGVGAHAVGAGVERVPAAGRAERGGGVVAQHLAVEAGPVGDRGEVDVPAVVQEVPVAPGVGPHAVGGRVERVPAAGRGEPAGGVEAQDLARRAAAVVGGGQVEVPAVELHPAVAVGVRAHPVVAGVVGVPGAGVLEVHGGVVAQHLPVGAGAVVVGGEVHVPAVVDRPDVPVGVAAHAVVTGVEARPRPGGGERARGVVAQHLAVASAGAQRRHEVHVPPVEHLVLEPLGVGADAGGG